jgi:hypothetical protein
MVRQVFDEPTLPESIQTRRWHLHSHLSQKITDKMTVTRINAASNSVAQEAERRRLRNMTLQLWSLVTGRHKLNECRWPDDLDASESVE